MKRKVLDARNGTGEAAVRGGLPEVRDAQAQAVARREAPALPENLWQDLERLDLAMRLAELLSKAETMPVAFRGKPADCLRVVELALRYGTTLFGTADEVFVVGGRVGFSGKFVAALLNRSGVLEHALRYEYEGEGQDLACTVIGRRRGEPFDRTVRVTLRQGLADSRGAKERWQRDPEQMLAYYGARVWARRHAPEVMLGVWTADELEAVGTTGTVVDVTEEAEVADAEEPSPPPSEAAREVEERPVEEARRSARLPVRGADGEVLEEAPNGSAWLEAYRRHMPAAPEEQPAYVEANLPLLERLAERAPAGPLREQYMLDLDAALEVAGRREG